MPPLLDRFALFYPMRIVGSYFMIALLTLYAWQAHGFNAFYFVMLAVGLVYPHVVQHFARKYPHNRMAIEMRAFVIDSFILGIVIESTGFTPLPTLILVTVALVNALEVNGPRQMMLSAAALVAGIALPMAFVGVNFAPTDVIALDIACSVFLFVYFMIFAYSSYNRNALLVKSQTELREQKEFLEIEKLRSDRLLYNLVPTKLAAEMVNTGSIRPAAFESVTLIGVELRGFSHALQAHDAHEAIAHLMHCFKAFDAITSRYGLEKVKTMGDIYIAIAGLPAASAGDATAAVDAALEIREFVADLNESRRAHGGWALDAVIAVHSGKVIGGIVETAKMSYDVWGEAMKTLLVLLRASAVNQVAVSEASRQLAADTFDWKRVGQLDGSPKRSDELDGAPIERVAFHYADRLSR